MRKTVLFSVLALVIALLAAACGGGEEAAPEPETTAPPAATTEAPATTEEAATTEAPATTEEAATTEAPDECAPENLNLVAPGQLTIGTGNPAYPPWYGGDPGDGFEVSNPYSGEGYESAVAYAVAEALGFAPEDVVWVGTQFNQAFAPGPKDWDLNMQQIGITKKRAKAVDFSEGYFDNVQALVTVEGSPVVGATTFADLKDAKLGVPVGTTSFDYVVETIQPNEEPAVYDDQTGAIQALKNGQIDGIVVDLYTGFYIRDAELDNGVIVGQFPPGPEVEQFGMTFVKGNPLAACVNQAIDAIKADGTLEAIAQEWLADQGSAPLISG
jgi:polar amino acid transport system substrate-binding protein